MFIYIPLFHLMLQACKRPFQASCIHWDPHLGPDTCMASILSHLFPYPATIKIYNYNPYDVIRHAVLKMVWNKKYKGFFTMFIRLTFILSGSTNKEKTPPHILLIWTQCFIPSRSARQCIKEGVAQLSSCLPKVI